MVEWVALLSGTAIRSNVKYTSRVTWIVSYYTSAVMAERLMREPRTLLLDNMALSRALATQPPHVVLRMF